MDEYVIIHKSHPSEPVREPVHKISRMDKNVRLKSPAGSCGLRVRGTVDCLISTIIAGRQNTGSQTARSHMLEVVGGSLLPWLLMYLALRYCKMYSLVTLMIPF